MKREVQTTEPSAWGLIAGSYFFLFAMLVAQCGCATLPSAQRPRSQDGQEATAVKLEVACAKGDPFKGTMFTTSGGWGSGVIISETEVLTAAHVVDCDGMALIHTVQANGVRLRMSVVYASTDVDIARLTLIGAERFWPGVQKPIVSNINVGDVVCSSVSHPERVRNCGRVATVDKDRQNGNVSHDFYTINGNSGGPVYNTKGHLVGIVTHLIRCMIDDKVALCGGRFTKLYGLKVGV